LTELHHIALGAQDVERVAGFYRDVLGLAEQARHLRPDGTLRSVWLRLGSSSTLMVEYSPQARPHVDGVGPGLFLLAVRVTEAERARLEAALATAGAAVEQRTAFTSYARDPEGNRVAISHHPLTVV
jgi:catechol-2,3-dioxygenase